MAYDPVKVLEYGLHAAAHATVDPDQAVKIVKALLAEAAMNGGKATATIEIKALSAEEHAKKGMLGGCIVTGQVCVPILGCVCICLVPPGTSC